MYSYEWDTEKDMLNLAKHGLPLELGALIFDDLKHVIENAKPDRISAEARLKAIGFVGERLYCTIYVERGNIRRLISTHSIEREKLVATLRKINLSEPSFIEEEVIMLKTAEQIRARLSSFDFSKSNAMTDAEIITAIKSDPDAELLSDENLEKIYQYFDRV